jgi:hypothetical protein
MENMILGIMNEIAVYDNKTRADRSRLGKFEKVKLNFWRGGDPPFGYKIQKMEGGSKLVINPEESKWVQFIFNEYINRTPMRKIKEALESNKVKTRRGNTLWTLGSLQVIIRNEVYTGVDVYYDKKFEETITSETPIIITEKTFALANEQRVKTLQRKGQLNRTTRFYLLRDFMICESCGTPMGARMKEQGRKPFYYCPLAERKFNRAEADDRTCLMKRSLNIPTADSEIWNAIKSTIGNTAEIKNKFNSAHLLGSGLADNEIVQHKIDLSKKVDVYDIQKSKLEKALVKIESDNLLEVYDSIEIYKGVKRDLTNQYKSIKTSIEKLKAEQTQLGNHQLWLDWIDQFGEEFNATNNLSDTKKKRLINGVVRDILVNYDPVRKLHRVRTNFRLPVLRRVGEILHAKATVLKRVGSTPNKAETIENTGAPEIVPSTLLHRNRFSQISRLIYITTAHYCYIVRK